MTGRTVTLPSGATLEVQQSGFVPAKALYQAMLEELKVLQMDPEAQVDVNFWKNIFCAGLSSRKIDQALKECLKRALYDGERITDDTFEDPARRGDYVQVLFEVAQENVAPFMKGLFAQYSGVLQRFAASTSQASRSEQATGTKSSFSPSDSPRQAMAQ